MLWWKTFPDGYIFGEEGFFTQPGYLPRQYPLYVARAFLSLTYAEQDALREPKAETKPEQPWYRLAWEAAEAFAQRWGGFDEATLQLVLHQGPLPDQLAAIFALGHSSFPGASDSLAPLLHSNDWLLRCAAACCLVLRRDERAIPVIKSYLLLPAPIAINSEGQVSIVSEASGWYDLYKQLVPWVLAEWGPSSLLTALRRALLKCCKAEANSEQPSPARIGYLKALSYALGRRGSLGALHGIRLPPTQRWLTSLYLTLGYLRAAERFDREDLYAQLQADAELGKDVLALLHTYFALDEEQALAALKSWQKQGKTIGPL
ncbi:HEAT repeat domain-containing protein [Thermogemmatispora sp.]|uniref:HEAT repeat domain-containing protein n=1 Tax=Thermogemmatispora sp. TaxID=1968838 RepID=UPI0035E428DC